MSDAEHPEHSGADRWQLETAVKLHLEYGHDWATASHLAQLMRDTALASSVNQVPAIMVTGF